MVIIIIRTILLLTLRIIDRIMFPDFDSDWDCLHGREPNPQKREVFAPGYHWEVIRNSETGDVDILPLREDHDRGSGCSCSPRIDLEGAYLVIIHNAYDKREIVEEAVKIMNGESK